METVTRLCKRVLKVVREYFSKLKTIDELNKFQIHIGSEGELNECTRVPSHRAKTRSREQIKVKLSTEPREQKPSEP
jgi:hypothetical protein